MNTNHQSNVKLEDDPIEVLAPYSSTRWSNAYVFKARDEQGLEWVVKDFTPCNWLVRNTIARLLLWREKRALQQLLGVDGIPEPIMSWGKWALAYPYIPGVTLHEAVHGSEKVGEFYFEALEALVNKMHEKGIAHLDLRNKKNILITAEGKPALIDFQSAVSTRCLPARLRRLMFIVDLSGVYKYWGKLSPETMTAERKEAAQHMASLRRFWVLKGYPLQSLFGRKTSRKRSPNSSAEQG